ncbi:MAG: hypothetical protein JWO67_4051 [Streptosporangiaceae bacterium]|nr:hypothetical protein [Streptosporangiaceae bacterium]
MTPTVQEAQRLASWQEKPCPWWCDANHTDNDAPEDRGCFSTYRSTPLPLEDPVKVVAPSGEQWALDEVRSGIERKSPGALPILTIGHGDIDSFAMPLDDAQAFIDNIQAQIDAARAGMAVA